MTVSATPKWDFHLICLCFSLIILALLTPKYCLSYELLIGTDQRGSFSNFAGKRLCNILNVHAEGITCKTIPNVNSAESLTNLQNGALDFALVNSKMIYDAHAKQGFFKFMDIQYDDLRLLLPFYREPVTFLVKKNADILRVDDLAGKRVNSGAPASLKSLIFREIMEAKGWEENSFSLLQQLSAAHAQDYISFNSGNIQAMIHVGMHPDRQLENVLKNSKGTLLGISDSAIDQLAESKTGFCTCFIRKGTYKGVGEELKTLAMETLLITSADIDDDTVVSVLETLFSTRESLQRAHPSFLREKIDIEILNDSYLHPHPTAILYFQENLHRL